MAAWISMRRALKRFFSSGRSSQRGLKRALSNFRVARGLYRLTEAEEFSDPDLVVAALKAPGTVVCLISALAFHGITTQIPRAVHLAVPRGKYAALRLRTPPVKVYRFDPVTFEEGVEVHRVDGKAIRIYGVARTLVDCFKCRNKIGLDVAVEALRPAVAGIHSAVSTW